MLGNSVYFLADRGRKDALAMTTKKTTSCKNRFVFQVHSKCPVCLSVLKLAQAKYGMTASVCMRKYEN